MFKKAILTQPGVYKSFIIGSKNQGRKCHENIFLKKYRVSCSLVTTTYSEKIMLIIDPYTATYLSKSPKSKNRDSPIWKTQFYRRDKKLF